MVEREPHSIPYEVGLDVTDRGSHDAAADQDTTGPKDDMRVQMGVGQQPRAAFHLRATCRDVDQIEVMARP